MEEMVPQTSSTVKKAAGGRFSPGIGIIAVVFIILAVLPFAGLEKTWLLYFFLFFTYLAMANMWNLLAGYAGLVALCQAAFIGIAGYSVIMLTWVGIPFYIGIVVGMVMATLFALLLSVPVFRTKGTYFAIGTMVVPEALRIIFLLWKPVGGSLAGGGAGYQLKGVTDMPMTTFYWVTFAIAVGTILLMRWVLSSNLGWGLAAIKDNDLSAASIGINVFRLKLYAFLICAAVTGLMGGVYYTYQAYIEPISAFNISLPMTLILAVVIGGMGTIEGPILGTVVVVALHFVLSQYTGISLLIQGLILIFVMLVIPQGLMGFLRKIPGYRSILAFVGR